MWRAAFLPWPMATVTVRSAGTMSPPTKMPGCPVIRSGPTSTTLPENVTPGTPSSAADKPDGPAPTTSTRRPVGCLVLASGATGTFQPCRSASSPRKRSTELMPTAESSWARLQAVSHGR